MVLTSTYITLIIMFIAGIVTFEYYFKKHKPNYGYGKLLLITALVEFLLVTMVVLIPETFFVLIYGSVLLGTYVCVYYRHKPSRGGLL